MKTKKALICTLALSSMFLTGTGVFLSKSSPVQSINHNAIEIKRLNTSTDPEGHVTYTFTYNVMPATATDMTCAMTLAYSDGADCSQVVNGFLDPTTKTISVTNYAPFDKQIILTINSVADPSIKSTVAIDYEKKVLGGYCHDVTIEEDWQGFREFDFIQALDVQYSIYSLDKKYNFNLVSAMTTSVGETCFSVSDESLKTKYSDLLYAISYGMGDRFTDPLSVVQTAKAEEDFSPSKWLAMDKGLEFGSQWANFLADVVTNKAKIIVDSNLTFDAGNSIVVGGACKVSFDLYAMGYTANNFYTAVTSVQAESTSLVF